MDKLYNRINFENSPSINTPLSAANLNKMDKAIDDLDDRVIEMSEGLEERIKSGVMDGEDGATFTPSVSEDGTLSWSNDKGLKNPSDVNIKGEKGSNGNDGKDGTSVTHEWNGTILSVTSASGTSSVDLKGAKGDTGATGPQGPQGPQGLTGPQGPQGDKGDTGATGAKGDTGEKGEKGDNGINGNDGKDGISATHSWNGTVLTITSASGTTSANLKGEQGIAGEKGADGTSVSIHRTSESEKDGGNNVVVFSDGTYLNIKNGSKGDKGDKGDPGVGINLDVTGATQGQMLIVAGVDENGVPTSWAAVDRTHWDDSYNSKILPETSYPKEYVISESFGRTLDMENLIPGETYRVMWNKTEYIFEAKQMVIGSVTCCYIGNAAIPYKKEDTGEPFSIISTENSGDLFEGTSYLSTEIPDDEKDALPDTVTISVEHIVISSQKLDEKYLPDSVATKEYVDNAVKNVSGGSGSGGVTSWNDLEDRPFYTDGGMVEILPECQPVYDEAEGSFILVSNVPTFVVGESYVINWNGTEYECTAQDLSVVAPGAVLLGNGTVMDMPGVVDNGEPFVIIVAEENGTEMLIAMDLGGATELTLSIYGNGEVVHKLDNKYLDLDWLPTKELVEVEILPETTSNAYKSNRTLNPTILPAGTNVIVVFDGVRYELTVSQYQEAENTHVIGDGSLTTIPFCFMAMSKNASYALEVADENDHTITVYRVDEEYNVIPDGFLGNKKVTTIELSKLGMESVYPDTTQTITTDTSNIIKTLKSGGRVPLKLPTYVKKGNSEAGASMIAILDGTETSGGYYWSTVFYRESFGLYAFIVEVTETTISVTNRVILSA